MAGLKKLGTVTTDCSFYGQVYPAGYDSYMCVQLPVTGTKKYEVQVSGYGMTGSTRNVIVSLATGGTSHREWLIPWGLIAQEL